VDPTIIASLIGGAGTILAGLAMRESRKNGKNIGQANGNGTLAQMMTKVIVTQEEQGNRLAKHIEDDATALKSIDGRLSNGGL
jgi:hypothetical protein